MGAEKDKQTIIEFLDQHAGQYIEMADLIWDKPEIMWEEFFAAKLQADFLEAAGFTVTRDVAGMNTAFIAEWGAGAPVIGFIGEYDALPGLSQKKQEIRSLLHQQIPELGNPSKSLDHRGC